jgi:predicted porin
VGIPLPSDPIIANENIFLSGIIEKQQAYQAEISYTISPQWELSASATLENIKNKDNTIGENENNTSFQLELNYEW